MPELSIVVVTHKAIRYVRKLFDSLYLYPPFLPFEVICVDNASCPPVVAYLKSLESKGKIRRLLLSDRILSHAEAARAALRLCYSKVRYVLFLDPNTEFESPSWFEMLVSASPGSIRCGSFLTKTGREVCCLLVRRSVVEKLDFSGRLPQSAEPSSTTSKASQRSPVVDLNQTPTYAVRVRPTERQGKFAVVSMAFGENYGKVAKISFPTFAEYAKRIGADFVVLNQRKFPEHHLFMEKFQVRDLLEKYDAVLWVDADAFISRRAPSIFDEVPPGTFAAWEPGGTFSEALENVSRLIGVPVVKPRPFVYFSAGVFVVWRNGKSVFADLPPVTKAITFGEQTPLNLLVARSGVPFHSLPMRWNSGTVHIMRWTEPPNVIHFAGDHTDLAHRLSEWIALDRPY